MSPPSSPQTGGKGGRKPLLTVGSGGLDQFTLGDIRKAEKTLEEVVDLLVGRGTGDCVGSVTYESWAVRSESGTRRNHKDD